MYLYLSVQDFKLNYQILKLEIFCINSSTAKAVRTSGKILGFT